jgi:hypothetical protein
MVDYSLIGGGIGLIPLVLSQILGGNSSGAAGSNLPSVAATSALANAPIGAPSGNFTLPSGLGVNNGTIGLTTPPASAAPATGAATPTASATNPLGSLGTLAMGLMNSGGPSALPSGATSLAAAKPAAPVSYAGSGPNAAALVNPSNLASLGTSSPLGPAASNPLLAMLLSNRLGGNRIG